MALIRHTSGVMEESSILKSVICNNTSHCLRFRLRRVPTILNIYLLAMGASFHTTQANPNYHETTSNIKHLSTTVAFRSMSSTTSIFTYHRMMYCPSHQPQLPRNNLQYQTSLNNSGVSLNVQYNVHIHLPQNDVLSESPTKNPIGGSGKNAAKSTIKPLTGLIDTENGLTYYYEYDPNIVPFDKQPILFVVPDPSNQPLPQPQNLPMQPHTPGNSPMYLNSAASVQPPSNTVHPNGSSTMRYNLNPSTQHSNYSNAVMQNAPTPNPQHHVSTNSDLKVQSAPQMLSNSTERRQNISVSAMQNGRNANMLQNSSTAGTLQGVPTNPVQQVQSAFDTHHWHIPRSQTPYVYTKRDYRNAFHFPDFIFNHDLPPIPEEASPTTPVHRLQPRPSVNHEDAKQSPEPNDAQELADDTNSKVTIHNPNRLTSDAPSIFHRPRRRNRSKRSPAVSTPKMHFPTVYVKLDEYLETNNHRILGEKEIHGKQNTTTSKKVSNVNVLHDVQAKTERSDKSNNLKNRMETAVQTDSVHRLDNEEKHGINIEDDLNETAYQTIVTDISGNNVQSSEVGKKDGKHKLPVETMHASVTSTNVNNRNKSKQPNMRKKKENNKKKRMKKNNMKKNNRNNNNKKNTSLKASQKSSSRQRRSGKNRKDAFKKNQIMSNMAGTTRNKSLKSGKKVDEHENKITEKTLKLSSSAPVKHIARHQKSAVEWNQNMTPKLSAGNVRKNHKSTKHIKDRKMKRVKKIKGNQQKLGKQVDDDQKDVLKDKKNRGGKKQKTTPKLPDMKANAKPRDPGEC
eukprot:194752_1